MTTALPSPRRTTDPDESTSPGALSASFDSPVSADWSTVNAPVRSFTSAGMMSPGRTRTMSPGTSSRAGMTCQPESRRTRALTCNRRRSVSTTPAARCSCIKLNTALTTSIGPTTARSEYLRSTADSAMISSSIHSERPQNLPRNTRTGCPFLSATSLSPHSFRRVSTSARVRPVSGSTWSAARASGTDAEAISGAFPIAGFEGAGSTPDLFGVGRMVTILCQRLILRKICALRPRVTSSCGFPAYRSSRVVRSMRTGHCAAPISDCSHDPRSHPLCQIAAGELAGIETPCNRSRRFAHGGASEDNQVPCHWWHRLLPFVTDMVTSQD